MMNNKQWSRKEQLLALRLYLQLPFGQLHKNQSDIIRVSKAIGRTPSAVAMKSCNFASLDPGLNRKGLGNASKTDIELWNEFIEDSEHIADIAEEYYQEFVKEDQKSKLDEVLQVPEVTESEQLIKVRRVQSFFRKSVLVSYDNKCAITCISDRRLIIASHIIPWKDSQQRRADPTNGIALNSFHDRLFDQGLMTFDEDYRVILSQNISNNLTISSRYKCFIDIEGEKLNLPSRFKPDSLAMDYHRNKIFKG